MSGRTAGSDRRVPFFLVAGIAALALYYPTPEKYRWVPLWLGIVYVVLAVLTAVDQWSRDRRGPSDSPH
jgi:hypothetical protein